ncbi:tyrosine-type recombinase/integrase [Microbacterium sp. NPDC090007]|uniref:tyrosine-type recombinase/integrase n=1 Tax=Microbacterium sp. NPDC090007 TaxID=3364204 RepID=UPI0037F714C1
MPQPDIFYLRIQKLGPTDVARTHAATLRPLLGRFRTHTHPKRTERLLAKCSYASLPPEARAMTETWRPAEGFGLGPEGEAFVRDAVSIAAPHTAYSAKLCINYTARYVHWCRMRGYPLTAESIWSPISIDLYSTTANLDRTEGTRRNYRAVLMRISETLLPEAHPDKVTALSKKATIEPYTAEEMAGFRDWAGMQLTPLKSHRALLILVLCAGAGVRTSELAQLRAEHIVRDHAGTLVDIPGDRARVVPLLTEWEEWVTPMLERRPNTELLWGNIARRDTNNIVSAFTQYSNGTPPRSDRLRNTWMATHLVAGTPVKMLMRAAGVETLNHINLLLKHLPDIDEAQYLRALRGESQR